MTTLNSPKKQYSQPEIIEIGDAVQATLGWRGWRREYRRRRRRRYRGGY
ncbi:hypothetical protein GS682_26850 [Nostoc sp. B(2019)]|nr:hypothetical protein [Nostoc sp. MG11]NDJ25197.1 hypothetical protein [Nostoc sp. B(2019)]